MLLEPIATDERMGKAFRVGKAENREVLVPLNAGLADTGNVAAWASSYGGFLRAFTESILASALPAELPRSDTLDEIYRQVEERLVADPARYESHYISVGALPTRT